MVEPKIPSFVHKKADDVYRNYHAQLKLPRHAQSVIKPPSGDLLLFTRRRFVSPAHDTPQSVDQSIGSPANDVRLQDSNLPSRAVARRLCERALLGTDTLVHVVHVPTFNQSLKHIYESLPEKYGTTENTFLPLLYSVLAVGVLLSDEAEFMDLGYKPSVDEGLVLTLLFVDRSY